MGKNCFFIVMVLLRCQRINKNRSIATLTSLSFLTIEILWWGHYYANVGVGVKAELNEWLNGWDKNDSLADFHHPFAFLFSHFLSLLLENDWIVFFTLRFPYKARRYSRTKNFHHPSLYALFFFELNYPATKCCLFLLSIQKKYSKSNFFLYSEWHLKISKLNSTLEFYLRYFYSQFT